MMEISFFVQDIFMSSVSKSNCQKIRLIVSENQKSEHKKTKTRARTHVDRSFRLSNTVSIVIAQLKA